MTNKRMTGKDYRKEYVANKTAYMSLKAHVKDRLRILITLYPEAPINKNEKTIKASDIDTEWFEQMSTQLRISIIETIEEWSEEQQGVQQLKI